MYDGKQVIYDDDDDVIGTYVDKSPHWQLELDVCGEPRRYAHRCVPH